MGQRARAVRRATRMAVPPRTMSDALMAADSLARAASCAAESIRCSDPARSTSVRVLASPDSALERCTWIRTIACERDDASCTPVAAVARTAVA